MSIAKTEGSFTGISAGDPIKLQGDFNISVAGFGSAQVDLERSFDTGSTWKTVEAFSADADKRGYEPEEGILYRLNCTAHVSGTIVHRLSQ